jgi:hypothetical protein
MTNTKSLPSIDYLRQRLRYEPETGKLFWLDYEGMPKNWRTRWAGKEAFTAHSNYGYLWGRIDYHRFKAHRVAWALHFGEWPADQIDHINGVKDDNRIDNLRAVTNQENSRNASLSKANKSGTAGVFWHNPRRKWLAHIGVNGRYLHLGCYNTIEEAIAARKEAATKYGFTERHGTKVEEVE